MAASTQSPPLQLPSSSTIIAYCALAFVSFTISGFALDAARTSRNRAAIDAYNWATGPWDSSGRTLFLNSSWTLNIQGPSVAVQQEMSPVDTLDAISLPFGLNLWMDSPLKFTSSVSLPSVQFSLDSSLLFSAALDGTNLALAPFGNVSLFVQTNNTMISKGKQSSSDCQQNGGVYVTDQTTGGTCMEYSVLSGVWMAVQPFGSSWTTYFGFPAVPSVGIGGAFYTFLPVQQPVAGNPFPRPLAVVFNATLRSSEDPYVAYFLEFVKPSSPREAMGQMTSRAISSVFLFIGLAASAFPVAVGVAMFLQHRRSKGWRQLPHTTMVPMATQQSQKGGQRPQH